MNRTFLVSAMCFALVFQTYGRHCPAERSGGGYPWFHPEKESKRTVTVRELAELPVTVSRNLLDSLERRIGRGFFRKVDFDYGYAHDFDSDLPLKAGDIVRVDVYHFVFKFSDPAIGLKAFHFGVATDPTGRKILQIDLPKASSIPESRLRVSCDEAISIAVKNGFPRNRIGVYFRYDWRAKDFVWYITDRQAVDTGGVRVFGQGTFRAILVNAMDGSSEIRLETIII